FPGASEDSIGSVRLRRHDSEIAVAEFSPHSSGFDRVVERENLIARYRARSRFTLHDNRAGKNIDSQMDGIDVGNGRDDTDLVAVVLNAGERTQDHLPFGLKPVRLFRSQAGAAAIQLKRPLPDPILQLVEFLAKTRLVIGCDHDGLHWCASHIILLFGYKFGYK